MQLDALLFRLDVWISPLPSLSLCVCVLETVGCAKNQNKSIFSMLSLVSVLNSYSRCLRQCWPRRQILNAKIRLVSILIAIDECWSNSSKSGNMGWSSGQLKKKHKMVSEQVATATVFLGAHASSLHWRGDAETEAKTWLFERKGIR